MNFFVVIKAPYFFEASKLNDIDSIHTVSTGSSADGAFSIADVVMSQKYVVLNGDPISWQNADISNNGCVDLAALNLMKHELLQQKWKNIVK